MPSIEQSFNAPTMANLFYQVCAYMRKWPSNAYGTGVVRGGVKKITSGDGTEHTQYWATVDRFTEYLEL